MAFTNWHWLALVPECSENEDIIAIIFGCSVPLILRPVSEQNGMFEVVGSTFCEGIMQGEVLRLFKEGKVEKQTFTLV